MRTSEDPSRPATRPAAPRPGRRRPAPTFAVKLYALPTGTYASTYAEQHAFYTLELPLELDGRRRRRRKKLQRSFAIE